MSVLRTSSLCFLLCAVLVHAYSDYYRPIPKKHGGPGPYARHAAAPSQKYAATVLGPPAGLPKMNRFYRPRHGPRHGPVHGAGGKVRGGKSGSIKGYAGPVGYAAGLNAAKLSPAKVGKILAKIPIKTRHSIKFREYPIKAGYSAVHLEDLPPQIIEVMARSVPLSLIFKTSSSKINIKQKHESEHAKQYGGPKQTYSVDEPHVLKHSVTKPIYQIIHESIQPYRKVTQTVNPVHEEVTTHVATSHKAPAALNAYQVEPVLYVSPEAIKSQAEYKAEPVVGNMHIEGYHGQPQPLVVSQYAIEQHLPQQMAAYPVEHLEQQHLTGYEAIQPVEAHLVEAPVADVQPVAHADIGSVAPLAHSEPVYGEHTGAVPAPPPVAVVADASLLDTYMKYAQISAEDLLLPVYQATHTPETYVPNAQHTPQFEAVQVGQLSHEQAPLSHSEPLASAAPVAADTKGY